MRTQVVGGQWSVVRSPRVLFNHFLKLLTDYRSVKTINGDAYLVVVRSSGTKAGSVREL